MVMLQSFRNSSTIVIQLCRSSTYPHGFTAYCEQRVYQTDSESTLGLIHWPQLPDGDAKASPAIHGLSIHLLTIQAMHMS